MIEKNGKLIDGTTLHDAISKIDRLVEHPPLCYMTNCVHPEVLKEGLLKEYNRTELVKSRFKGIQANTSPLSPAELDGAKDLKCSDPEALAKSVSQLSQVMELNIVGGCCGTDDRHMRAMVKSYLTTVKKSE